MIRVFVFLMCAALLGCVSGAPKLTAEQNERVANIRVYKRGIAPERAFSIIAPIKAADCSGPGGSRFHGYEDKAIDILIKKTAALGGDAIVDVACEGAPFVNNCWVAWRCDGNAASWK
jgi:hypothetical protein